MLAIKLFQCLRTLLQSNKGLFITAIMNEYTEVDLSINHLSAELAYFKEKLLTYIRTHGNDSNFEDYLNNETNSLLSQIKIEFEEFEKNVTPLPDNNAALQKAKYVIKLQNLSVLIGSHVENSNNS